MAAMQTMTRTSAAIDDEVFPLAQSQNLSELEASVETALRQGGAFVHFTVVGNREISALITPHTRVVLSHETVQLDDRDTGDHDAPFGGMFDF